MSSTKPHKFVPFWIAALALLLGACSSDSRKQPSGLAGGGTTHEPPGRVEVDPCATPQAGCSCDDDGKVVDCGRVAQTFDDYVTCSMGSRTCADGEWGECIGDRQVQVNKPSPQRGYSIESLGSGALCPAGFDLCDPYCYQTVDTPGSSNAGSNFIDTPTGLKLKPSSGLGCTTLTVTPSSPTLTITQISPLTAVPVTLTATLNAGCIAASPFNAVWTVDRFDLAQVTGSTSANGSLTPLRPVTGTVRVTAYAVGISGYADIQVKLNVADSPTTDALAAPNKSAAQRALLAGVVAGSGNSVTWLYPYASTYFPLALPAPVLQYSYTSGTGGAVKATLRYPANKMAATADFNYSLVVKEENTVSQTAGVALNSTSPQITVPAAAWSAFEQSARGNDADLFIQRVNGANVVETEKRLTIHFVDGQLKGTVFYNSYSSLLGPTKTGAVLKISPGATTPTLAIQPASGVCTVCHTVNSDGSKIIAAGYRVAGNGWGFNQSRRFDMTSGTLPAPTVLNNYDPLTPISSWGTDGENKEGDRFNFGAVWTDGSLYMTHGGDSTKAGDKNWRAPPDYSRLYDPNVPGTSIPVTGWSNISAVTPKFSQDGTKLAFGFWGGSGSTLACSTASLNGCSASKTLAPVANGTRLVIADFTCATPPCTSSSSFTINNARDLTPSIAPALKMAWPAISPDNSMVVFQRQYRSSKALTNLTGWSPSDMNTVAGALAELWVSKVPANSATAATPVELKALNGLTSAGANYLPSGATYHVAGGSTFTINKADDCTVTASATGVNDYQLNYLPAFSPTSTASHYWVVFTSRRMYGNIATDDPWDAEPGFGCNSGVPPTKKLWIAAVDKTWTSPNDPSHPAFYLPGQELKAGNSDGFWVNSACGAVASSCTTSDDCCGGTGATPTARCDALTSKCQTITACQPVNQTCVSTGDCCSGLVCGGASKCINPDYYIKQTYQREFTASCPTGTKVAWRLFEWQATIPTGTSIGLAVQTRATTADPYQPATAAALGTISASVGGSSWGNPMQTVDQVFQSAAVKVPSLDLLLVSMTFNASSDGATTPELDAWRMGYDCKPAE